MVGFANQTFKPHCINVYVFFMLFYSISFEHEVYNAEVVKEEKLD